MMGLILSKKVFTIVDLNSQIFPRAGQIATYIAPTSLHFPIRLNKNSKIKFSNGFVVLMH